MRARFFLDAPSVSTTAGLSKPKWAAVHHLLVALY